MGRRSFDRARIRSSGAAFAVLLALGAVALAFAAVLPARAVAHAESAERVGSITVHVYRTQIEASEPGSGGEDPALPSDALSVPDVPFELYQLSTDPEAANGFEPEVGIDSPPLPSFEPRSGATDAQGALVFDDLPRGVYLLVQGDADGIVPVQRKLLVAVPMQDAAGEGARWDVHVYPKSFTAVSLEKEAVEPDAVYGVGDEVSWRIAVPTPARLKSVAADGTVRYGSGLQVRDLLDARLDFVPGARVSLVGAGEGEGVAFEPGRDYQEAFDEGTRTVSWSFSDEALRRIADAEGVSLVIDVATRVNEAAYDEPGAIFNNAAVSFTTASGQAAGAEVFPAGAPDPENPDHPRIRTGGLRVDKRLEGTSEPLAGAEFKVARTREDALAGRFLSRSADGARQDVLLVTGEDGTAEIGGLGAGAYWLLETRAPSHVDERGASASCVRLVEPASVEVPGSAGSAMVKVAVENRLETPFDRVAAHAAAALARTGDGGWSAAVLLVAVVALVVAAWLLRAHRRKGRADKR